MKKLALIFCIMLCFGWHAKAQAPEGFNHQAVIKDNSGELLLNKSLSARLSIIDDNASGGLLYREIHSTTTNSSGLINLKIGSQTSDYAVFTDIAWSDGPKYMKVEIDDGNGYDDMGTFQLLSVPYALYAKSASKAEALGQSNVYSTQSDTLFVVKDHEGNVVFAIFSDGAQLIVNQESKGRVGGFAVSGRSPAKDIVNDYFIVTPDSTRIYVNDTSALKGRVGGFAVSGRSPAKGTVNDYLFVTNDSTRIYVNESVTKGRVGGFAVSGRSPGKGILNDYLVVTNDSTRVYVNDTTQTKGRVGGFAVSGRSPGKGIINDYLQVTRDSTRVYINESSTKGRVGGFAVSGRSPGKSGVIDDYFNISGNQTVDSVASDARIFWYPKKEAFLAGRVLVEKPDSVGLNSFATGYHSMAKGNYSQAFGYEAKARGNYSTAIGKNAIANKINSFAFGESAQAKNEESYAIGREAMAEGFRSFAFGSAGIDSAGNATPPAKAIGDYSFAIGQGSTANGYGSIAMGLGNDSYSNYSLALGYKTVAQGYCSTTLGYQSIASGAYSMAIGYLTTAPSAYEIVVGRQNEEYTPVSTTEWSSSDRLFVIGNGEFKFKSNAMTVLKNGQTGIGTVSPNAKLHVKVNKTEITTDIAMIIDNSGNDLFFNPHGLLVNTKGTSINTYIINATANAASRFYVRSDGNVGIGTTTPTFKMHVLGDIYANGGWLRVSDNAGLYFESYGGGWYMTDTQWIRTYGDKSIYQNSGTLRTDGTFNVGSNGSTFYVVNNGNFAYRSNVLYANTSGNVGIGTINPTRMLEIQGKSGDTQNLVFAKTNYTGNHEIRAFYGESTPAEGYGYGGEFIGGHYGVYGIANSGTGSYGYGVYGTATGTSGTRVGGEFVATSSVENNYGIFAHAANATGDNYAGYFSGNVHITGTFTNPSDLKLKSNLKTINDVLSKIKQMKVYSFEYKKDNYRFLSMPNGIQFGLIAQDLELLLPELVSNALFINSGNSDDILNDKMEYKSINYIGLIPLTIKGIQEQQEIIDSQKTKISELEERILKLEELIKNL